MAKLCRIHFAGLGQDVARFNPLTIDLRNPKGDPQDSVIWLRNGGGKTTLISLLYSVVVPRVSDFLGMRTQKNARLEDFLHPNEVGVVAIEWLLPGGGGRRVIGQIAVSTAREFKRWFFSFAETATFSFDSLPVLGLATPAGSMDKFLDALKDAMKFNPSMELVLLQGQNEWVDHLDKIGLDSELFKTHIVMNSQEGGAADIFKIKMPEDFVRKFLELAYDDSSSEELEKSLAAFRQKRLNAPNYKAAIAFGESLSRLLTVFVQDIEKKGRFQKEEAEIETEMGCMLASIQTHTADLARQIKSLADECSVLKDDEGKKVNERRRATNTAKGYNRHGKRLRVQEAEAELRKAETEKANCQKQVDVVSAAKCLLEQRARQAQYQALVEQRDRLLAEVRPLLDALMATGSRLVDAWNRRISDLHTACQLTDEDLDKAKSELKKAGSAITLTQSELTGAIKDRGNAESAIRNFEEARRHLQETGALLEDEECDDAMRRVQYAIKTAEDQIPKLASKEAGIKNDIQATKASEQDAETRLRQSRSDVEASEAFISREAKEREEILQMPMLLDISHGEVLDLHNAHLRTQVESYGETAQTELVTLGVKAADDKRDALSLEKSGLLAPSTDIDVILSRFRAMGITSAIPAYRWLAEQHLPSGATKQLQRHPLTLSGIIIQNESDYIRAQSELVSADIRSPIALIRPPKPDEGEGDPEIAVITPARLGLFSKTEAEREKSDLDNRQEERAAEVERYQKLIRQAEETGVKIREFASEFSLGRMQRIRTELAAAQDLLTLVSAECDELAGRLTDFETQKEAIAEQKSLLQSGLQKARGELQALIQFDRDHDQKIEGHRKTATSARQAEDASKLTLVDLKSQEAGLETSVQKLTEKAKSQYSEWNLARTDKDRLPQQYLGEPTGGRSERPEEVAPLFNAQVQEYEGKAKLGPIEGELNSCGQELTKAKAQFEKASLNLQRADIEGVALSAQIDQDLSDAKDAFDASKSAFVLHQEALNTARREASTAEAEFKSGDLQLPPSEVPATSMDAFSGEAKYLEQVAALSLEIEAAKERHAQLGAKKGEMDTERAGYEQMAKRYDNLTPTPSSESRFTGQSTKDDEITEDLSRRRRRASNELQAVERRLSQKFDDEIQPLIQNPDLDKNRIPFRDALKRRARADFDANAADYLTDIQQQVAAYQHDLNSEEQELKIIVGQLDGIARRTTSLLGQTESASRMPETLGVWAGLPFLKIVVPKKNDEAERYALLGQALETWYERGNIPTGSGLAFACVYAVCGAKAVTVRMLKPEYHLSPVLHEITDLIKFSDGEKLTAAILLYCVLVRLRAKTRAKLLNISGDSGMLLLDNPFGKATLASFVDLQVKMARLNGVQLVYATGVNDFGALKSFGHIVRLRNTSRNRVSGDYHVTQDLTDRTIEGIAVGVQSGNANNHPENGNGSQTRVESQNRL